MTTTARHLQHKDSYIICRPSVDFLDAQRAYFIYSQQFRVYVIVRLQRLNMRFNKH